MCGHGSARRLGQNAIASVQGKTREHGRNVNDLPIGACENLGVSTGFAGVVAPNGWNLAFCSHDQGFESKISPVLGDDAGC